MPSEEHHQALHRQERAERPHRVAEIAHDHDVADLGRRLARHATKWNPERQPRRAAGLRREIEPRAAAVERIEPLAGVAETDALGPGREADPGPGAVVGHVDHDETIGQPRVDLDAARVDPRGEAVPDSVLDERLQQQYRDGSVARGGLDADADLKTATARSVDEALPADHKWSNDGRHAMARPRARVWWGIGILFIGMLLADPVPAQILEIDALLALQRLAAATRLDLTYQEYARQLSETKRTLDRFLQSPGGAPSAIPMALAMAYYELAGTTWRASIEKSTTGYVLLGQRLEQDHGVCPDITRLIETATASAGSAR